MKRIIALVLMIVYTSVGALAELPDIVNLSNEELRELQVIIVQEFGKRKELPSFTAPISVYEAGKDFPSGKYTITATDFCTIINIYDDPQSFATNNPAIRDTYIYGDSENAIVFEFKDGSYVDVSFSSARFEPFYGLEFE